MLMQTDSYRTFLNEELGRRMKVNPRYSQRAFARQLGLSAGELSEILSGKRGLSLKSAIRIAKAMALSQAETKHLLDLTQLERTRRLGAEDALAADPADEIRTRQLTLDLFHVVSDWFCFAILNLAECEGFRFDPAWISRRLGISVSESKIALERLERVGLLERKAGELVVTEDYVISSAGIPSEAIRNYHRQILQKAANALETQSLGERDFSGIGIAVNPRHIEAIRKEISDFQDHIVAKYSKGRKTDVYQLEIALFRLTEPGGSLNKTGEKNAKSNG